MPTLPCILIAFVALLATTHLSRADAPVPASSADPATMMPNEWEEFRYERLAVLQAEPALVAENKELRQELQAQQKKVESAMIKVDPKVAPLITKVAGLLRHSWETPAAGSPAVSPEQWEQLRAARAAALQANPDLATANKALLDKKKAFEDKVDAAFVKADPNTAAFVARLQQDGH